MENSSYIGHRNHSNISNREQRRKTFLFLAEGFEEMEAIAVADMFGDIESEKAECLICPGGMLL